jgi:short-subunit dehydrogenase
MNIVITGTSSGVGQALAHHLCDHTVVALTRDQLDLGNIDHVLNYSMGAVDLLINCAGTDIGGKIDFVNHHNDAIVKTMTVNLLSPVILTQKALKNNAKCRVVNITSTNNRRYYANNLAYSLSKKALEEFGNMLKVDYPDVDLLEIRLGLIKTNFNQARYKFEPERFDDVYVNQHLTVDQVVVKILDVLFDSSVKFIEVSP